MADLQLHLKGTLVSDAHSWSRPFPKAFEGPFSFPVCLLWGKFKCWLQIRGATLPLANSDISRTTILKHSWNIDVELINFKFKPKVGDFQCFVLNIFVYFLLKFRSLCCCKQNCIYSRLTFEIPYHSFLNFRLTLMCSVVSPVGRSPRQRHPAGVLHRPWYSLYFTAPLR